MSRNDPVKPFSQLTVTQPLATDRSAGNLYGHIRLEMIWFRQVEQRGKAMLPTTSAHPRRRHSRCAFTLVELLVVIGIIALLIAILMPTLRKSWIAAQNAQCLSNLRQIGQATTMYRQDTGRIPWFFFLRNGNSP